MDKASNAYSLSCPAFKKMVKARSALVLDHPFFGSLALRLDLVQDIDCETAWSNGRSLAFNPVYIDSLKDSQVQGLIGHEVMHLACAHHLRRGEREHQLWNQACDLAINWILLEAGLELPPGYLDDPDLRNLEVEAIYKSLLPPSDKEEGQDGLGGQSEDDAREGMQAKGDSQSENSKPQTGSQEQKEEGNQSGRGQAGGGDQQPASDSEFGDPGRSGEVRDGWDLQDGSPSSSEQNQVQKELDINLVQAFQQAKALGKTCQGLERLVRRRVWKRLPWSELLRRFIENCASNDYSWNPPNRRYVHSGWYLPSISSQQLPRVVVGIDTSGSISEPELEQFSAELSGILQDFDTRISVLYCDCAMQGMQEFSRFDLPLHLKARGGGGTDYRPVFNWVQEQGEQPVCLIYLTDLECNRFPEPPDYPVLWVSTGKEKEVVFGEVLKLEASKVGIRFKV